MKIAFYNRDIEEAAELGTAITSILPNTTVQLIVSLDDPAIKLCDLVVADPAPYRTADWLSSFRRFNKNTPLILISGRPDLLRGSLGDGCFALAKPYGGGDLLELIEIAGSGSYNRTAGSKLSKLRWQ